MKCTPAREMGTVKRSPSIGNNAMAGTRWVGGNPAQAEHKHQALSSVHSAPAFDLSIFYAEQKSKIVLHKSMLSCIIPPHKRGFAGIELLPFA